MSMGTRGLIFVLGSLLPCACSSGVGPDGVDLHGDLIGADQGLLADAMQLQDISTDTEPAGDHGETTDTPGDAATDSLDIVPADSLDGSSADTDEDLAEAEVQDTLPDTASPPAELVLWTFNLLNPANPFGDSADVNVRTQIVIDAIYLAQPDLIAFQEVVDSSGVPNRAEFIAAATGYEWAWQQEYSVFIYDEGIAILSRWPILDTASVKLPHDDLILFTRYVLGARVESPAGPIDFYCTHMTVGGNESQSADQALAAYEFITERSAGLHAFFAGDLNAEPDTLAMQFLRGEAEHGGVVGDFVDGWPATNPDDQGLTIEAGDPHDRIDYIYAASTGPTSTTPLDCELIFDEQVNGVFASDHIGVSCTMALAPE